MNNRVALMIRRVAAQGPVPPALSAILGVPVDGEGNPIPNLTIEEYFRNHADQLPAVQNEVILRAAGDKVSMFPEGYDEDFLFPVVMADRISGNSDIEKQTKIETLKTIFDQLTEGAGSSWTGRFLSTAPEVVRYINILIEE